MVSLLKKIKLPVRPLERIVTWLTSMKCILLLSLRARNAKLAGVTVYACLYVCVW